jgi:hypothetical protein
VLSEAEQARIIEIANEPRFSETPPAPCRNASAARGTKNAFHPSAVATPEQGVIDVGSGRKQTSSN